MTKKAGMSPALFVIFNMKPQFLFTAITIMIGVAFLQYFTGWVVTLLIALVFPRLTLSRLEHILYAIGIVCGSILGGCLTLLSHRGPFPMEYSKYLGTVAGVVTLSYLTGLYFSLKKTERNPEEKEVIT